MLLAEDPSQPQQKFALKIVPCDHLEAATAARARDAALAEAELLQRLRHPHVVTCHMVRWDPERHVVWIALDYMNGGDLQSVIDGRRNSQEPAPEMTFVRRVLSAVGSALRFIHSQDVLHRDVKPSNVLLTGKLSASGSSRLSSLEKADIKLADFGISKILEATTNANTVVGTPPYMSPEIVCGKPYGPASDAWALGACIYELVMLRRPFEAGNQLALVRQIVEAQPAALAPGTAPDVEKAVRGLLEKDPQRRLSLGDVLLLSSEIQALVMLPPAPPFAPPTAPELAPVKTCLAVCELAPLVPNIELPHDQRTERSWSDVSEETLCDVGPASPRDLGGPKLPGFAFGELETEKAKEKHERTPKGRRWFKFGKSTKPSALVRGEGGRDEEGELTYVTAFAVERGECDSPLPAIDGRRRKDSLF